MVAVGEKGGRVSGVASVCGSGGCVFGVASACGRGGCVSGVASAGGNGFSVLVCLFEETLCVKLIWILKGREF